MSTTKPPLDESMRDAYLRRLGFGAVPPPTVATLYAVHRAQVERVPYESVWVWLGERRTVEPLDSIRYLLAGRGGYCYHHNGALGTLLGWLGFDVHWHVGGVQGHPDAKPNVNGNHLALTVTGLPSEPNPGGEWYLDAGLGDGLHEPLPLLTGAYRQGPHTYGLRPSEIAPGGWRFAADPVMALHGMDFRPDDATPADLRAEHENLQSAPDSGFVRVLVVMRRDAGGVDYLRGRVLKRIGATTDATEVATRADWFACLADMFDLPLSDVDEQRKTALWHKVVVSHEEWLTTHTV
jgi:arylamine N-acetyltransferase